MILILIAVGTVYRFYFNISFFYVSEHFPAIDKGYIAGSSDKREV